MSGSGFRQSGVIFYCFLLILFITNLSQGTSFIHHGEEKKGSSSSTSTSTATEMVPLITDEHSSPEMMNMAVMNLMNETETNSSNRRKLNSFRICALCTCCGGPKGVCLPSPCCYAINCNIPNRPFGFCAFTPKTCNCLGCHL